jgi:hypothetical protein
MNAHAELIARCQELETTLRFWTAANDAKAQRVRELELECQQLRQRVARLGRLFGRRTSPGR